MKFASGGGAPSWSTASDKGIFAGGAVVGSMAPSNNNQLWNGTTWASSTNMGAYARTMGAGGGNSDEAVTMGGDTNSGGNWGSSPQNSTQIWDGSATSWSQGNAQGTSLNQTMGGGTASDAIIFTGTYSELTNNQEYDGTNWSAATVYPIGVRGGTGDGLTTDAIGCCGYDGSSNTNGVYIWDNTSWTSTSTAPDDSPQGDSGGCGLSNNFIYGYIPDADANIASFDGSSWTASIGTAPSASRATYGGDLQFFWKAGGDALGNTTSEYWDGSSFTSSGSLAVATRSASGAGGNS